MKNILKKTPTHIIAILGSILLLFGMFWPFFVAPERHITVIVFMIAGYIGFILLFIYAFQWVIKIIREVFKSKVSDAP